MNEIVPIFAGQPPKSKADVARSDMSVIANSDDLSVALVAVTNHRTSQPATFDMPIDADLAADLLLRCKEFAATIADAELSDWNPGFTASEHQCLIHDDSETGAIDSVDERVQRDTHPAYTTDKVLGRQTNLLALRVVSQADGRLLSTFYQSIGTAATLEKKRRSVLYWSGQAFTNLSEQALVLRPLELAVTPSKVVVAKTSTAYSAVFGALPELASEATQTFDEALRPLGIEGSEALEEACTSDKRMMIKLVSIRRKMANPAYADKLNKKSLISFIRENDHVNISIAGDGDEAAIVFESDPQHRWAILKLLDDDYLRSDLTETNYEANSKQAL